MLVEEKKPNDIKNVTIGMLRTVSLSPVKLRPNELALEIY